MKKIIAIVTVLSMIFSLQFVANALLISPDIVIYQDSELDLTQYSMEDLSQMSSAELRALISDFERIYDPFGSYEKNK